MQSENVNQSEITASNLSEKEPYRMALCINDDLKMTKGKAMAQCAHAAVGVYESYFGTRKSAFEAWEKQGKHISIFKITDGNALESLGETAENCGLITCLVRDAGRTQIPSGSMTVLAIGPALKSELECLTQYLLPYT
ncbi:hypothetical protein V9T40_003505 [Parthenolecanium corni]|uniref:peptidyl-tRNA hydrolase n=1 Tax=Parthenolecanium corni TaxID=536013 RepID=A0AAN9TSN5_9HEMI